MAIGTADQEYGMAASCITPGSKPRRKFIAGHLAPVLIEGDNQVRPYGQFGQAPAFVGSPLVR